ncbi:uncharacterized protein MYCFIDRAFT_176568 [Pseudocercospora fijiensis CIRAD86]|uniref:Uncharacterized protein n=1 Tax=Pseudocercospora fijiensis (strain CIRAD86) TaxID=383855 RepID=M2ZQE1_PSEFD|nr:uncharacterized protein MYCFIDRAFT_176568 [Pseudocercospora fijiensis CIRAD86]EME81269.1 hypothetical protein MYCFIDRAFT_176568 [Pseudocercospora fijiensis CIRAD86]
MEARRFVNFQPNIIVSCLERRFSRKATVCRGAAEQSGICGFVATPMDTLHEREMAGEARCCLQAGRGGIERALYRVACAAGVQLLEPSQLRIAAKLISAQLIPPKARWTSKYNPWHRPTIALAFHAALHRTYVTHRTYIRLASPAFLRWFVGVLIKVSKAKHIHVVVFQYAQPPMRHYSGLGLDKITSSDRDRFAISRRLAQMLPRPSNAAAAQDGQETRLLCRPGRAAAANLTVERATRSSEARPCMRVRWDARPWPHLPKHESNFTCFIKRSSSITNNLDQHKHARFTYSEGSYTVASNIPSMAHRPFNAERDSKGASSLWTMQRAESRLFLRAAGCLLCAALIVLATMGRESSQKDVHAGKLRVLLPPLLTEVRPLHSHLKRLGTHIRGASWARSELFDFAPLIPQSLGLLIGLLGTSRFTMARVSPLNLTFFPTAMGRSCKPHLDIGISCSSQVDFFFFFFFPLTPNTTFNPLSTLFFSFSAFDKTSLPLLLHALNNSIQTHTTYLQDHEIRGLREQIFGKADLPSNAAILFPHVLKNSATYARTGVFDPQELFQVIISSSGSKHKAILVCGVGMAKKAVARGPEKDSAVAALAGLLQALSEAMGWYTDTLLGEIETSEDSENGGAVNLGMVEDGFHFASRRLSKSSLRPALKSSKTNHFTDKFHKILGREMASLSTDCMDALRSHMNFSKILSCLLFFHLNSIQIARFAPLDWLKTKKKVDLSRLLIFSKVEGMRSARLGASFYTTYQSEKTQEQNERFKKSESCSCFFLRRISSTPTF